MLRVTLVVTCLLFLVSSGFRAKSQDQVPELTPAQKEKLPIVLSTSIAIRRVARILDAQRIRIEAGQLFSQNGMKKLRPQLPLVRVVLGGISGGGPAVSRDWPHLDRMLLMLSRPLQVGSELRPGGFAHQRGFRFPLHRPAQLNEKVRLARFE